MRRSQSKQGQKTLNWSICGRGRLPSCRSGRWAGLRQLPRRSDPHYQRPSANPEQANECEIGMVMVAYRLWLVGDVNPGGEVGPRVGGIVQARLAWCRNNHEMPFPAELSAVYFLHLSADCCGESHLSWPCMGRRPRCRCPCCLSHTWRQSPSDLQHTHGCPGFCNWHKWDIYEIFQQLLLRKRQTILLLVYVVDQVLGLTPVSRSLSPSFLKSCHCLILNLGMSICHPVIFSDPVIMSG